MIDYVIPQDNEDEFISIAERLGYKDLCFLYKFEDYFDKRKRIKIGKAGINVKIGILADSSSIYKIKNKLKGENVLVAFKGTANNKDILERLKPNILFSLEENPRKDFIHQRASGLNHIMCKIAKENDIAIGFSIKSILYVENKRELLGRIAQNLNLCRKYKVKTIIASFADNPLEMRYMEDINRLFEKLL